jgi:hypothetical protein
LAFQKKEVCMPLKHTAITTQTTKGTVRPHQPGQAVFRAILSEDIDWKPFAAFPPSARLAVLVGHPSEPGPYVVRVKLPHGVKLMPHTHPEDRIYTVISGVFYIGVGAEYDADKLEALSARRRDCFARQYTPLPLGEIRRLHHAGDGDRAAWP